MDYTYKYGFQSGIEHPQKKPQLSLATCNLSDHQPYFFSGKIHQPRLVADMLLAVNDVVRTHYFLPMPPFTDPVLTSNEALLRVEGFSGCCGVYIRADLPVNMFEGDTHGRGTTNVDFNQPMRNALMQLRDQEDIQLSVGKDEVALSRNADKTVEKKVKMPLRWIKGFSEVQAYQPALSLEMEVPAAVGLQFIRSLPKTSMPKKPVYALYSGRGMLLSHRPGRGAVKILGTHRLNAIESLLYKASSLKIWADQTAGTSAWEVCYPSGSVFLMISPEVYRGFSGEGQLLNSLAAQTDEKALASVRAQLKWQSQISIAEIANTVSLNHEQIKQALAVLSSRGLVGYDADKSCYFHRELPFDYSQVEAMQPRLKNARKIIDANQVQELSSTEESKEYAVKGSDVTHRVKLAQDSEFCTCPWFSKHQGERGPCKHILAAQIIRENNI